MPWLLMCFGLKSSHLTAPTVIDGTQNKGKAVLMLRSDFETRTAGANSLQLSPEAGRVPYGSLPFPPGREPLQSAPVHSREENREPQGLLGARADQHWARGRSVWMHGTPAGGTHRAP